MDHSNLNLPNYNRLMLQDVQDLDLKILLIFIMNKEL